MTHHSFGLDCTTPVDLDPANRLVIRRASEIDGEKSIRKGGADNLDPFGKHEALAELPGGNAAVKVGAGVVLFGPAAADDELFVLYGDIELIARETGNRQGDPQHLAMFVGSRHPLDIVGRIAVAGGLGEPVQRPFDFVEAEEKRTGKRRDTRHSAVVLVS